jgi:hypothetical protein
MNDLIICNHLDTKKYMAQPHRSKETHAAEKFHLIVRMCTMPNDATRHL